MNRNLLWIALFALIASVLLLSGCSQNGDNGMETPTPTQTPTPAQTPAMNLSGVAGANSQFAFELYSRYAPEDGNIHFSPYSISTALAMTYEGARGETAEEIRSVFHFPADDGERRGGYRQIYEGMNAPGKNYSLSTANALWAQNGYPFLASYFSTISEYYNGNATNLDFRGDTEGSRLTINKWVEERTEDRIKELLKPGMLDSSTRLVITNAVYFMGKWERPFGNATSGEFRVSPGNAVTADMMRLSDSVCDDMRFNYAEDENAQIIELPYEGGEVSMLVLLPKEDGISQLEQSLSAEGLEGLKGRMELAEMGRVELPRFKFETEYDLTGTLPAMGMGKAFEPGQADFSGMDGTRNLYIGLVVHKAFIQVNETGTEAAAATAVVIRATSIPNAPPKPSFVADHPFIFVIQQRETGNILFMGRISDPTAE